MATSKSLEKSTPQQTTSKYFDISTETLPSRPLRTAPVLAPSAITTGEHILFLINTGEQYRPVYRSALVESVSEGNVVYITYTPGGVRRSEQPFRDFKSLHRVDYTDDESLREMAVEKAKERLGECHYHGLFNNSHHFVSWTKTGLEYSLADLVHGVEGEAGPECTCSCTVVRTNKDRGPIDVVIYSHDSAMLFYDSVYNQHE